MLTFWIDVFTLGRCLKLRLEKVIPESFDWSKLKLSLNLVLISSKLLLWETGETSFKSSLPKRASSPWITWLSLLSISVFFYSQNNLNSYRRADVNFFVWNQQCSLTWWITGKRVSVSDTMPPRPTVEQRLNQRMQELLFNFFQTETNTCWLVPRVNFVEFPGDVWNIAHPII